MSPEQGHGAGHRRTHRPLQPRHHPLRDADRREAVHRLQSDGDHLQASQRAGARAARAPAAAADGGEPPAGQAAGRTASRTRRPRKKRSNARWRNSRPWRRDPQGGHGRGLGREGRAGVAPVAARSCELREEGRVDGARAAVRLSRRSRPHRAVVAARARGTAPLRAGRSPDGAHGRAARAVGARTLCERAAAWRECRGAACASST